MKTLHEEFLRFAEAVLPPDASKEVRQAAFKGFVAGASVVFTGVTNGPEAYANMANELIAMCYKAGSMGQPEEKGTE